MTDEESDEQLTMLAAMKMPVKLIDGSTAIVLRYDTETKIVKVRVGAEHKEIAKTDIKGV